MPKQIKKVPTFLPRSNRRMRVMAFDEFMVYVVWFKVEVAS
jgi:hypothetical protein